MSEQSIHPGLSRNVLFSMGANIFYLATRLIVPPFILHYVSLQEYGIWSYCFILIGYLGMSVIGLSSAYIRYGAIYASEGRIDAINRLITTGMMLVTLVTLILGPLAWIFIPRLFSLFHIPEELQKQAFFLFFGTTLIFLLDLICGAFSALLQGLQKFVVERSIWVFSFTVETMLIFLLLYAGAGLYGLLWAYLIRTLIAILCYAWACFRLLPGFSLWLSHFDLKILPLFLHFGGIVQVTGVISLINRSIEKVLAGLFLGPAATALYEVGEKFPMTAMNLPASMNMVFLPTASHLHSLQEHKKIARIYLQGGRWVNLLTGSIMGFMAPFAAPIILCWLGSDPKFASAVSILACFTIAYQMDVITGPVSAIYRAVNQPERELVYPLLQLVLVLIIAAGGIALFGASIPLINATVASMMVLSALIYLFLSNRFMQISQRHYLQTVLFPGLLPYLLGYFLFVVCESWFNGLNRWEATALLAASFGFYSLLLGLLYYFLIFDKEERAYIKNFKRELKNG